MMAISHNASNTIQGKPLLDIDAEIERYKLLDILGNTEFIRLIGEWK
jgi:3-dehydroquinate synthase class II